jgi:cob(I)alamin adenosyltransferase
MKKIKVYTKTGDSGTTSLISGKRVPKHHLRIKAYGTIDELNCWFGIIRSSRISEKIQNELITIQKKLMIIGTQLSNDSKKSLNLKFEKITIKDVSNLESMIDIMTDSLPDLKNFIIPGGNEIVSNTHLTRCVCRRAERCITELNEYSKIDSVIIFYINRLSDYLFTLSRKLSYDLKIEEVKWIS